MTKELSILHVSTHGRMGGAGLAAWRLHSSMVTMGVRSNLLCLGGGDEAPGLISVPAPSQETARLAAAFRDLFITSNRTPVSNTSFTAQLEGVDINHHPAVQTADIIHLHWVSGFVRPPHLAQLLASGKTVVWTLHDMGPFTGGCHYSAGCTRFLSGCQPCPQLRALSSVLAASQLADKITLWKGGRLGLIALNRWMAALAGQAPALRGREIATIPNGIDLARFTPDRRRAQRQSWGVADDTMVLLFAADSLSEIRKGADLLAEALACLAKSAPVRDAIVEGRLLVVTAGNGRFPETGLPIRQLGWTGEEQMADCYAGADLFILPSLEDNQPNTVVESLACGTPVIAFAVGGVSEMIRDHQTGQLVQASTAGDLAAVLAKCIDQPGRLAAMRPGCRAYAEEHFNATMNTRKVLDYYQHLFSDAPKTKPGNLGDFPGPALAAFLDAPQPEMLGLTPAGFLSKALGLADQTQIEQHASTSRTQAAYIATLERERDRLTVEANDAQTETKRAASDAQQHIDELMAQIKKQSATSQEQDKYIAILEKERDRLTTLTAIQAKESEHYLKTINEQTAYIKILEAQRALTDRK